MNYLVIAIYTLMLTLVAALSVGRAQNTIPPTTKLYDETTKEFVGTLTRDGNRFVLRDKDGNHTKTMVRDDKAGTITSYDPNGNFIETVPNPALKKQP